ncbi:MAG: hypothetical protein PHO10_08120, partial [Gemmiger sp.]|nr:hypothetical protein [Gemmiger sp.]
MAHSFLTDAQHSYCRQELPSFGANRYYGMPLLKISAETEYQSILGFGASFTDASCFTLNRLAPAERKAVLEDLLTEKGLGLSIGRLNVGASDYSTNCYCYDEKPDDFAMEAFSIDRDREYLIPIVQQAKQINPDIFLFSSMWSCPGWMKTSGSMCGGWLRPNYLEAFADYYIQYLLAYKAAGLPMDALTCQNEPETDQVSKMPACYLHPDFERELVGRLLPARLRAQGLTTKLWLLDHNFIHWNRARYMLQDKDVQANAAGVAFHPYEGDPSDLDLLHAACPDAHFHLTEVGPDIGSGYAAEWCRWAIVISDALAHGCESFTAWNYALDETGSPNIGPFPCGGLVTVDSQTKEVSKSSMYYALQHFSTVIRRGARRIAVTAETALPAGVRATGYKNV